MKFLPKRFAFPVCLLALCVSQIPHAVAQQPSRSAAENALDSIFNPQRAPAQKSMGLLQRSFLDLVETSESEIQIAVVIDGTESMAADIQGVRRTLTNMVDDLRRYKGDRVSLALVVYRDVGSTSGEVTVPLAEFTSDRAALKTALDNVAAESGQPYFPELVDLGVHAALSRLQWSGEEGVTRWLMVFGDAPPYDPDFNEEETGARRRYDTDLLIDLARRKNVTISCVLCNSRKEDAEIYRKVVDKTRRFMNALATNTGGLMLDLSYPDIRAALVRAARKQRVQYQPIGRITPHDVTSARANAQAGKLDVANDRRVRIAILPPMPLKRISFDGSNEAVHLAAELRHKFRMIPRVEVKSPIDVERHYRRLKTLALSDEQLLQALALRLRVDYVVWGDYRRSDRGIEARSAIYRKDMGKPLVRTAVLADDAIRSTDIAGRLTGELMLHAVNTKVDPLLAEAFGSVRGNTQLRGDLLLPISTNAEARRDILTGFDALEKALALPVGGSEAGKLLREAEDSLKAAGEVDVKNPFAQLLLANCCFNQAQAHVGRGETQLAKAKVQQFGQALKRAYRHQSSSGPASVRQEILADYALLIQKDVEKAIGLYKSLSRSSGSTRLHSALRAHWMLTGIYSGDWGVDPKWIDAKRAREHLVKILAHWESSPEARFIKANLRWDDAKDGNQFGFLPRHNGPLVATLNESP